MPAQATAEALSAAAASAFASPFGAILKLAPAGGDPIWVDGRAAPPVIASEAPGPEDATWRGAGETLLRVLANSRTFESAFVSGRLCVAGDMSVPARIALGGS